MGGREWKVGIKSNMAAAREIPDKKTQRKEIKRDMKKPLRKRDTW